MLARARAAAALQRDVVNAGLRNPDPQIYLTLLLHSSQSARAGGRWLILPVALLRSGGEEE